VDNFPQTRQVVSVGGKNGSIWQYPSFSLMMSTGVILSGSFEVSNMSVMMRFESWGVSGSGGKDLVFSGSGFSGSGFSGSGVSGSGFSGSRFSGSGVFKSKFHLHKHQLNSDFFGFYRYFE